MEYDLVVVGGGPAGLACALEADACGVRVLLVDENRSPGGQLVKQIHKFFGSHEHYAGRRGFAIAAEMLAGLASSGVELWSCAVAQGVFQSPRGWTVSITRGTGHLAVRAKGVVIATGATENAVAFPGWTKPGVVTAGAAQTMTNVHRVLPGRRVVMVGSGNVGLIVSYQLLQAGAEVVAIVEAAPRVGGYAVHAAKLRRAGVPIWLSHTVTEVLGKERVEAAVLARLDERWKPIPGTHFLVEADTVCLAAGLTPQADLARMAGCRMGFWPELGGFVPVHDEEMRTSQPGIYVAGDVCGVEEASTAIEEGRLAGLSFSAWLGKLDRNTFEERKQEVLARLGELRGGLFGSPRASAKAKMAEVAREGCRATRS